MKKEKNIEKLTINLTKANLYSILIFIPLGIIFILPFFLIWGLEVKNILDIGILLPILIILGVIIHELIHGIFFARYAKNGFKSIKFGVLWAMLTPYCHCKEPLRVKHYRIGAVMPAIILGLIPSILSLFLGNLVLLLFGITMIAGGVGDFMILYLLRNENKNHWIQDLASEVGCTLYREEKNPMEEEKKLS